MRLRTQLTSVLRAHPYSRPFESYSASHKSTTAATLHDVATHISGQQPEKLYHYLLTHSRICKDIFPNMKDSTRTANILTNLKTMHSSAPNRHKSNVLSLVATLYTQIELQHAGFNFSHTQYTTARKKAQQGTFLLSDYQ